MIISVGQTVGYLHQAEQALGVQLTAEELRALAAIPSRESQYNTMASNQKGSDRSFGIWQINTIDPNVWKMYQSRLGLVSPSQLFDPLTNAKAAVLLVQSSRQAFGNGLWGWGPYKGVSALSGVSSSALAAADQAIASGGGMGVSTQYPTGAVSGGNIIDSAINWALTQQGIPYKFGGSGNGGWDCSNLTAAFLKKMGIDAPPLTFSQVKMGVHVDPRNIRPGDLIFVNGSQGQFGHVKIYLGGGLALDAPHTGAVVRVAPVNLTAIQEVRRYVPDAVANSAQQGAQPRTGTSVSNVDTSPAGDQSQNAPSALANASDEEVKVWVKAHYGTLAGFIDDPEIGPILIENARSGGSTQQLIGKLQSTNWWRLRDDAEKAWAQQSIDNPGQQAKDIGDRVNEIIAAAGQLGVSMTAAQVQALATMSLSSGWSTDQLKNQIIGNIDWSNTAGTMGELQASKQSMIDLGRHYFQNIDDGQAQKWAVAIQSGQLTEDGVKATLQHAADARWSFLKGVAPGDFWAPVQGAIANELEVPSGSIDMMDKKWADALERANPDGTMRPATTTEARITARQQPEWVKTDSAMHQISTGGDALMKSLTGSSPWS